MPKALKRMRFEHWGLVAVIGWEIVFLYDVIPQQPALDVTPVIHGVGFQHDTPPSYERAGGR